MYILDNRFITGTNLLTFSNSEPEKGRIMPKDPALDTPPKHLLATRHKAYEECVPGYNEFVSDFIASLVLFFCCVIVGNYYLKMCQTTLFDAAEKILGMGVGIFFMFVMLCGFVFLFYKAISIWVVWIKNRKTNLIRRAIYDPEKHAICENYDTLDYIAEPISRVIIKSGDEEDVICVGNDIRMHFNNEGCVATDDYGSTWYPIVDVDFDSKSGKCVSHMGYKVWGFARKKDVEYRA